jgi:polyphosphate kinase
MKVMRILATQLLDNQNAWELQANGSYLPIMPAEQETRINSQQIFMENSFGLDLLP